MFAVEAEDLGFSYGHRRALHGVSFTVPKQAIFGLLGPNGGGKTTLFRILCTLLTPDSGWARVLGWDLTHDPLEIRRSLGVVFQSNSLDLQLTPVENLRCQGYLYGWRGERLQRRIDELLSRLGLQEWRRDFVGKLSEGLRRRVELAKGLLHKPKMLMLDEPSQGLDPGVRRDLWNYFRWLRDEQGITILMTTHLMEEAERCDQLVILNRGRLVTRGSPGELKEKIGGDVIMVQTRDPEGLRDEINKRFACQAVVFDGAVRLEKPRGHQFISQLADGFRGQIEAITIGRPTLEDVFAHEVGHRFWSEESEGRPKPPATPSS